MTAAISRARDPRTRMSWGRWDKRRSRRHRRSAPIALIVVPARPSWPLGWEPVRIGNLLPTNRNKPCANAVAVSRRQIKVYPRTRKTMERVSNPCARELSKLGGHRSPEVSTTGGRDVVIGSRQGLCSVPARRARLAGAAERSPFEKGARFVNNISHVDPATTSGRSRISSGRSDLLSLAVPIRSLPPRYVTHD